MRSLPAVVSPQVTLWLATYARLQHLECHVRQLIFFHLLRGKGYELEVKDILASLWSLHINIEHCILEFPCYALSTSEYWGVVVQEWQPQVYAVPLWRLVQYVAE